VFLPNVPMVDQGQKGYCVVASVERVMRYFGAAVDQHELAQIANTETEGGTSPSAMMDSLKKLTMRLGVRVKEVYPFDFSDFMKMVDDHNRLAKRAKKEQVSTGGMVVDIGKCYDQMDPEILKSVRLKKTADFGRFQREIQRGVDEGLPLLWSMRLGLVSEPGLPQTGGGHMRLILGYNPKTKEILYSDSWGMGHEKKRMSFEDAWTITTGLSIIQPSNS
ncbi:MAG: C39 family peptidase, partial [Terrimicrobiaceae bacterium]